MRRAVGIICILVTMALAGIVSFADTSTINTTNYWVWASGSGWLNCRVNETNGAVIGEYVCSGYFYSESSGWVHLGDGTPTNGIYYSNDNSEDYGVNISNEYLFGYAWCESTGWVNFEWTNKEHANAPRIDLGTGVLTGYAWGDALGWIKLSNWTAYLETDSIAGGTSSETVNDFIPDAWEIQILGSTNLTILKGGTNDYDNDGFTDYYEYIANTCPTNDQSYFAVSTFVQTNTTNMQLSWASTDGRSYRVEQRLGLMDSPGWTNSGLGTFTPNTVGVTVVTLPIASTQLFYRIKAILPLQ